MNRNILYKAVVFDMDGVIFDSERAVMQCWKEVASRHNIPDIEKAILACTGTTMVRTREIMLNLYGADFPYDEYARESSVIFHSRYDGGRLPMKPGVKELLTFLKEHDKKIALASSTRQQVVTDELRDAGIIEYFDRIICGDMVSRSKPAPDIFLKACEELNVSPSDSYAIEDSYNGIRAAHAGGLHPIMVPDLLPADEEIEYFDRIICGDMVSRSKPAPDIFLKACEELNVSPSDSYAIEDSYNGIRAAHAGGLHPIMVPDLLPADEEMQSLAEIVLPSLTSVMEYLA